MRFRFLPLLVFALAGCDRPPRVAPQNAPEAVRYEGRGVLQKIDAAGRRAVIAHEEIPGYMEAMTMEFSVPDAPLLAGLVPGDIVTFRLAVTPARGWIDRLQKTGHTAPAPVPISIDGPPPGTPLPDCALTDARGQALRLHDFRGRALAFTFIFTRCPLPDYCPLMNRHLSAVQAALTTGEAANWQLLSLSFDPDYDTPARLAAYAAPYQPDPAHWTFATGRAAEVRALGTVFGLAFANTGTPLEHNLRTVVVDAAGRVQRVFIGNAWTAAELTVEMQRAMAAQP